MALRTLPVPFADSKTHSALKKLCSRCIPTRTAGLPGCRRELWGGPEPQQPLWPLKSPWRNCAEHAGRWRRLRLCVLCLFSQGSIPGLWKRDLQRGRVMLCSTKATIRNGFISRSGQGLQKGLGAVCNSAGLCLEGTGSAMVCAQCDGQCPQIHKCLCSRVTDHPLPQDEKFR